MENYILGIDFGMCNIKVAYYLEKGARMLKIDKNESGGALVPNVIKYDAKDKFRLWSIKKSFDISEKERCVSHVKRKLAAEKWEKNFEQLGFSLNAEEIARDIFIQIRDSVEKTGHNIEKAVITIPVSYSVVQQKRIVKAAENAGINVESVISEPAAAVFSTPNIFNDESDENIAVFDFGGATIDICVFGAEVNDGEACVFIKGSAGIDMGGVDVNNIIYEKLVYPSNKELIDKEIAKYGRERTVEYEIMRDIESAKVILFEDGDESVDLDILLPSGEGINMELELDKLEKTLDDEGFADRIRGALDELFDSDDMNMEKEDIEKVCVYGGSACIGYFRKVIEDYFGDDIYDSEDFDPDNDEIYNAVAKGAANYGVKKEKMLVFNSVPYFIGIGVDGQYINLINKNSRNLCSPRKMLTVDYMEKNDWKLKLYQSDSYERVPLDDGGVVYIGSVEPDREKYVGYEKFKYSFSVDKNGRLKAAFYVFDEDGNLNVTEEKEIRIGE